MVVLILGYAFHSIGMSSKEAAHHCWILKKNLVDFKYNTEELKVDQHPFFIFNPGILSFICTQLHILRATVGVLCDCKLVPEGARQLFCGLELSIQPGCLWHFDSWAVSHDYGHDWVDVVGNQLLDGSSSNVNKSQCSQLACRPVSHTIIEFQAG